MHRLARQAPRLQLQHVSECGGWMTGKLRVGLPMPTGGVSLHIEAQPAPACRRLRFSKRARATLFTVKLVRKRPLMVNRSTLLLVSAAEWLIPFRLLILAQGQEFMATVRKDRLDPAQCRPRPNR